MTSVKQSEILDISNPGAFKSRKEIDEYNSRNFPRMPEPQQPAADPVSPSNVHLKSKHIYNFNIHDSESPYEKLAYFRAKLNNLKERHKEEEFSRKAALEKRTQTSRPLQEIRTFASDIETMVTIEGRWTI